MLLYKVSRTVSYLSENFLKAARSLLVQRGRLFVIWPASDLETLVCVLAATGLELRTACLVRPFAARSPARPL